MLEGEQPTMTTTPFIKATPDNGQLTDEFAIAAGGFAPGASVKLSSELVDDAGVRWIAQGDFIADTTGEIDLATAPSEAGTFTGINPAGLFWSLRPESGTDRRFMIEANNKNHMLGQPLLDPLAPIQITLRASLGDAQVAESRVVLNRLAEGVEVIPVRDGRLRGMAFRQKNRSRSRGAIMSLTGSGGGVEMSYAPALASIGYDVFSLAYFAYEDLSEFLYEIPLEYFEEGFEWMKREFGATKLAVQGASRGGELSVALAAYLPHYVSGAIPIVPMYAASAGWNHKTGEIGPSWTYKGKEIPYAKTLDTTSMEDMKRIGEESPNGYPAAPGYQADMEQDYVRRDCVFPIENANGPLLMISGVEDAMWPCAWGSDLIVNRLRAKGFRHHYEHLALRETGHITPLPNVVTTFAPALYHTLAEMFLACGGTAQGAGRSARIMWNAMQAHHERVFT
jgi:acyl-coenzyme A thioesterase 1/2/4